MRMNSFNSWLMLSVILALPGLTSAHAEQQNSTLIVVGQPGQAPLIQMNGKSGNNILG